MPARRFRHQSVISAHCNRRHRRARRERLRVGPALHCEDGSRGRRRCRERRGEDMSATPSRRRALRGLLADAGLDSLLVTDLINIRYLTGFTGSNAAVLIRTEGDEPDSVFCTDGRYTMQSARRGARPATDDRSALRRGAAGAASGKVGFEARVGLRCPPHSACWPQRRPGVELIAAEDLVERLRAVKDSGRDRRAAAGLRGGRPGAGGTDRGRRHPAGPDRAGGRARPGPADARARRQRPVVRDHRRRRARTAPSRTTGRPARCCAPATSSNSTSVRRSTATTRT